jgi:hypothetical protein
MYCAAFVVSVAQCLVTGISDGKVFFDPAVGCDQGGPTPTTPGKAWDWWIENVLEECDSPGEYFYDAEAQLLFYTFNASEVPTGNEHFALTRTKVRFSHVPYSPFWLSRDCVVDPV